MTSGITLREAAELLPRNANGKPTSVETLKRWITDGYRGIKLGGGKVGKRWCTTISAVTQFMAECSAQAGIQASPTSAARERESQRIRKRLLTEGIFSVSAKGR
jgi:hypothetical protein